MTFAIPFYGSVEYLDKAITSVLKQTQRDWSVLVVDDCSPAAGARELVEGFGDSRITYTRNDRNLGIAGNWNRCIELSHSPLVTILHSDDELSPHYAETMREAHAAWPNAAAIFCNAQIIDANGAPMFSFRDWIKRWIAPASSRPIVLAGEEGVRSLLRGNFVMCPSLCYKRHTFDGLAFSARWRFMLDLDFVISGILAGAEFVGIRETAFRYRRHEDQVTVACERNLQMFIEEIEFWRWAAEQSRIRGWSRARVVAENMSIIKLQILYYAAGDGLALQGRAALKKLQLLRETIRNPAPRRD